MKPKHKRAETMKHKYTSFLVSECRKEMWKKRLDPAQSEKLIFDGKLHEYTIKINGEKRKAFYCFSLDSFGSDRLVLTGSYGYGKIRYTFSKSTYQFN